MNQPPKRGWDIPVRYGYAAAIDSIGSLAAPFLAGVSGALAIFVMQNEAAFGWANVSLLLLIGASLAFVAALQFSFWARQFASTPGEIEMWWSDEAISEHERLHHEQHDDMQQHRRWANRVRWSYNLGLLAFLLGLASCLVPARGLIEASGGRQVVVGLVVLGLVAELAWIRQTQHGG
jgi:hypothetical protein